MPRHKSKPLTLVQRQEIQTAYAQGSTMQTLATRYKVSISVIHRAVHQPLPATGVGAALAKLLPSYHQP